MYATQDYKLTQDFSFSEEIRLGEITSNVSSHLTPKENQHLQYEKTRYAKCNHFSDFSFKGAIPLTGVLPSKQ